MLLGMKRDVKQIVGILNSDFHSPAGPIQVERLIRKHLPLFEDLRRQLCYRPGEAVDLDRFLREG